MNTYIDYYFDPDSWVIPESIFINGMNTKNSGIKIKADFLNPDNIRFWGNGGYENWKYLGILGGNEEITRILIDTKNLFQVLQYSGVSEEGLLNGTYRLTNVKGKINPVYKLIPEDSRECFFKSWVSKTYYDGKIKSVSNMTPGHLYVSKYGGVFLCIKNKIKNSMSSRWWLGLSRYTTVEKLLYPITPKTLYLLDRYSPKTMEEFVDKICFCKDPNFSSYGDFYPYSLGYSGKDLGEILKPGDIIPYLVKPENLSKTDSYILLSEDLWRTNPEVTQELKRRVEEIEKTNGNFARNSQDFINLKNELRKI